MSPVSPKAISLGLERRRGKVEAIADTSVVVYHISGFVTVNGAGEALVDVPFPITFVEKPGFYYGAELVAGSALVASQYPTISVVVVGWVARTVVAGYYYQGARLACVTTGPSNMRLFVHWHMEGKAFRNPISGVSSGQPIEGAI